MFQQHVFTEKENNQEEEGKKEGRKEDIIVFFGIFALPVQCLR